MVIFHNNKTHLGGCNRNKNFPNNQYEGYAGSYVYCKRYTKCKYEYKTWKYGEYIDHEL